MPLAEPLMATARQSQTATPRYDFRLARPADAPQIVRAYENVFGKGGVKAEGHEAYPAPEVFSREGVLRILNSPDKQFVVAEVDGQIAGGMIINFLSPYNCEFACVAVDPAYRGLGLSPRLLNYARGIADSSALTINATEIVTHSVLSQTAHSGVGYGKVIGFGYCQYPRVFFKNHPESCLWIGEIQGRVADALRAEKPACNVGRSAVAEQSVLDVFETRLFQSLRNTREVFVPPVYKSIVSDILAQFDDVLNYRIVASPPSAFAGSNAAVDLYLADEEPYSYLNLPSGMRSSWRQEIDTAIETIHQYGKRFIQARIPANSPSAVTYAEYLRERGFALLGFLPLYQFRESTTEFDDLLVLQWIAPDIVASNPLPGETDSVIKLYGYPANLSGRLMKVLRNDLAKSACGASLPGGKQ